MLEYLMVAASLKCNLEYISILYITHFTLLTWTYCRTPLVGVPINSDQLVNVKEAVNANIGLAVPWTEMTEEKFGQAVNEVLRTHVM